MKFSKGLLIALTAVILVVGVVVALVIIGANNTTEDGGGLLGGIFGIFSPREEVTVPTTVPISEALAGDIKNSAKVSQEVATKSIHITQLSSAEESPAFKFYKDGAPLTGTQWAVTGKIRAETVADQEAQIYFVANQDKENQASLMIGRAANGTNGVYQSLLEKNLRTPVKGNTLVSRSLTDTTDWSAEFAFVFYARTVSLYLKEPGEDFLLMATMDVSWKTCDAEFFLAQNANVTLSDLELTTNGAAIKSMCDEYKAPLENPIDSMRLLFIGNSGTIYKESNVPELLTHLARNAGYNIEAGAVVLGNSNFAQHADATTAHGQQVLEEIAKGYDIVFLQELSSCICSEANRQLTLDSSKILDEAIRAANSKTYFYVRPPMRKDTYAGQSTDVQCVEYDKLFVSVANEIGATNVYVNRAYAYVIQSTYIDLWIEDNVHSNEAGEYLTVCVFFASLFNESATVLDYNGLDEEVAATLQKAADKVVFENYMPSYSNNS